MHFVDKEGTTKSVVPVQLWLIADHYPDLDGHFGVPSRALNTDSAICFICDSDVECAVRSFVLLLSQPLLLLALQMRISSLHIYHFSTVIDFSSKKYSGSTGHRNPLYQQRNLQ